MKTARGALMRRNCVGQPRKEEATFNLRPRGREGHIHLQSVLQAGGTTSKVSPRRKYY